jgi:hypothetical protein
MRTQELGSRLPFEIRRNRPVTTMGVQVTDENMRSIAAWCGGNVVRDRDLFFVILIKREGFLNTARVGDYVVRRPDQKFYAVSELAWKSQYYSETDAS